MQITEVRIKLMDDPHERLQAFCSITFDECFVIRDLKIIQGVKGPFVAMPSRKLTDRCPRCHTKNHLRAPYCNHCGAKLDDERALKDDDGRAKLYADIAHPINSDCREMIQTQVLKTYEEEIVRAQQPGYRCTYDDYGEDRYAALYEADDEPLEFPRYSRDGVRRIDAPAPPSAPHHAAAVESRAVSVERRDNGSAAHDFNEDEFGAGIV
ncbi:MAG: SpoVG family protein [Planctomycetaceae bacterium]